MSGVLDEQELQRVFGHMQEGIAKVYDPARFATLLGIDNGIQQDPQVCHDGHFCASALKSAEIDLEFLWHSQTSTQSTLSGIGTTIYDTQGIRWIRELAQEKPTLSSRKRAVHQITSAVQPHST